MKQKQRGSNRHKTRVKVTLKTKEIEIKGKKLNLEPWIEDLEHTLQHSCEDIAEIMGIPFVAKKVDITILDDDGFRKVFIEKNEMEPGEKVAGMYDPKGNAVYVNAEKQDENFIGFFQDDELEMATLIMIVMTAGHELAHMNHDYYDCVVLEKSREEAKKFIRRTKDKKRRIFEIAEKKGKDFSLMDLIDFYKAALGYAIEYRHILKSSRLQALIEGMAMWTEREFSKKVINDEFANSYYGVPDIIDLRKRVDLVEDDPHAAGYLFFEKISKMTDANVIRLAIQHHPTYIEMLYPELYILRMKAALLI